jgi:ketosteroid isomerase-like protein
MTSEENKKNDEIAIKRLIEGYVEAFRTKDLDGIMSIRVLGNLSFLLM